MCGISVLLRLCENLLREDNWSSEDDVPHLVSGTLPMLQLLGFEDFSKDRMLRRFCRRDDDIAQSSTRTRLTSRRSVKATLVEP